MYQTLFIEVSRFNALQQNEIIIYVLYIRPVGG